MDQAFSLTLPLFLLLFLLLFTQSSFPLPPSTSPPQPTASCWISSGRTWRTLTSPPTRWVTAPSRQRERKGGDAHENQRGGALGHNCHTSGAPCRWGGPVTCSHHPILPHHLQTLLFWTCPNQRNWQIQLLLLHSDSTYSRQELLSTYSAHNISKTSLYKYSWYSTMFYSAIIHPTNVALLLSDLAKLNRHLVDTGICTVDDSQLLTETSTWPQHSWLNKASNLSNDKQKKVWKFHVSLKSHFKTNAERERSTPFKRENHAPFQPHLL